MCQTTTSPSSPTPGGPSRASYIATQIREAMAKHRWTLDHTYAEMTCACKLDRGYWKEAQAAWKEAYAEIASEIKAEA